MQALFWGYWKQHKILWDLHFYDDLRQLYGDVR